MLLQICLLHNYFFFFNHSFGLIHLVPLLQVVWIYL